MSQAEISLQSYGCVSAAGNGATVFYEGLLAGIDHSIASDGIRLCRFRESLAGITFSQTLVQKLQLAYSEAMLEIPPLDEISLGVILSTIKGAVEDFIWKEKPDLRQDPLALVLREFLTAEKMQPKLALAVCNACASSHVAVQLASEWLMSKRCDRVLVLAADLAGPFVINGFRSLRALTEGTVTPFGENRGGLQLGEAAAALVLRRSDSGSDGLSITGAMSDTEGHAITRSSTKGESLKKCLSSLQRLPVAPDLLIAHGTGTASNDSVEDCAFHAMAEIWKKKIPVTSTKWSIGHTLGASGAMDLIAGAEILRRGKVFAIANTKKIDAAIQSPILIAGSNVDRLSNPKRIAVTSVGFGGVHAAIMLEKRAAS